MVHDMGEKRQNLTIYYQYGQKIANFGHVLTTWVKNDKFWT
jgi:hypothetical protein